MVSDSADPKTQGAVDLCVALATMGKHFRHSHIRVEKLGFLRNVTTTAGHGETELILASGGHRTVESSMSLDADLAFPPDDYKSSIGVSVAVFFDFVERKWTLRGDIGWSCKETGWEEYESFEEDADSVDELTSRLQPFVARALQSYDKLIAETERGATR